MAACTNGGRSAITPVVGGILLPTRDIIQLDQRTLCNHKCLCRVYRYIRIICNSAREAYNMQINMLCNGDEVYPVTWG